MAERLQKIIAQAGICSRRKAESLITEGLVRVNGRTVTDLGTKAEARDRIEVAGQLLKSTTNYQYILLYKPSGYITSVSDPRGRRTVMDLIDNTDARLYPVGRLDYNTSGLLLLTNDGELTNALLHPGREVAKTYRLEVKGEVTLSQISKLNKGIKLVDGWTSPANASIIKYRDGKTLLEISIHEGRNRQVRRMLSALNLEVIWLQRIAFAGLTLGTLKPGQWRHLKPQEVAKLKQLTPNN